MDQISPYMPRVGVWDLIWIGTLIALTRVTYGNSRAPIIQPMAALTWAT